MARRIHNQSDSSRVNEDEVRDGIILEEAAYYNASRAMHQPDMPAPPRPAFRDRRLLMESIKRGENPIWLPDQEGANASPSSETVHVIDPPSALPLRDNRWDVFTQPVIYNKSILRRTRLTMDPSPPSTPPRSPARGDEGQRVSPGPGLSVSPPSRRTSVGRFVGVGSFHEPTSPLTRQTNLSDDDDQPQTPSSSRHHVDSQNRRYTVSGPISVPRRPSLLQMSPMPRLDEDPSEEPESSQRRSQHFQTPSSPPFSTPPRLIGARGRRSSLSSTSSLQLSSMVGSYEESIIRGRMSGVPSEPVTFTAKIGVQASGKLKPKDPPQLTIRFPAVYHTWTASQGRESDLKDKPPSPYVGQIDLKGCLHAEEIRPPRRRRRRSIRASDLEPASTSEEGSSSASRPPLVYPSGGTYRIPAAGTLQILIMTQDQGPVGVFRIDYDVSDMEVGQKTWIRYRLIDDGRRRIETEEVDPAEEEPSAVEALADEFSSNEHVEPIAYDPSDVNPADIDPSAFEPLEDVPSIFDASQATEHETVELPIQDPPRKELLRYLMQVKICRPLQNCFVLYNDIRVVFPSNITDKTISEMLPLTVMPVPKYSPLRPELEMPRLPQRRLSIDSGIQRPESPSEHDSDIIRPRPMSTSRSQPSLSPPHSPVLPLRTRALEPWLSHGAEAQIPPPVLEAGNVDQPLPTYEEAIEETQDTGNYSVSVEEVEPDLDGTNEREQCHNMHASIHSISSNSSTYSKLSRGEAGYGGRPGTPETTLGLLSQGLRSMSSNSD